MQLTALFLAALPLASAIRLTWDPYYDQKNNSMLTVACSDGPNGLFTKGYSTLGDLPDLAFYGGFEEITWNSPKCGSCYELSHNRTGGLVKTIRVIGLDHVTQGFNIARNGYGILTDGLFDQGVVEVDWKRVNGSLCGLPF